MDVEIVLDYLEKLDVDKEVPRAVEQLAQSVSKKIKGRKPRNLNILIPPKKRKKFIKKLFHQNEANYRKFISLLNEIPSWPYASRLIDIYYQRKNIDPYCREALEFSQLAYLRYFPKDVGYHEGEYLKF